jgi:fatty acid synthase, animal type
LFFKTYFIFQITEGTTAIVTGFIREVENSVLTKIPEIEETDFPTLPTRDFYKELRLRGYHYTGQFRTVVEARGDGMKGTVKWDFNWVSFLDSLMQIQIIGEDTRALMLPTAIQKLVINPKVHTSIVRELDPNNSVLSVEASRYLNTIRCGGVEMRGLVASPVGRRKPPGYPVLETYTFIPHLPTPFMTKNDAMRVFAQLALENLPILKVKAIEMDYEGKEPIIPCLQEALGDLPLVTSDMMFLSPQNITLNEIHVEDGKLTTQTNCTFIIAGACLSNADFVQRSTSSLNEGAFMISREKLGLTVQNMRTPAGFQLLLAIPIENETLVLMQHQKRKLTSHLEIIKTTTENYSWLPEVRDAMKRGPVIVLAYNDKLSGVIGLVNCIRKEPNGHLVSVVYIDDLKAPPFELDHPLYKNHMKLGLAINVFKDVSIESCIITYTLKVCNHCIFVKNFRVYGVVIVIYNLFNH